jgi:adenosylhomocysteine nucleosidase
MCLGVVAAFDRETRMLTQAAGVAPESRRQALVAYAGMGAHHARVAGERLLNSGATALLSWGVAAALDHGLAPGNLLLPKAIINADLCEFAAADDWHTSLCERLAGKFVVRTEPLAESLGVLNRPAQKRALLRRSSAIAADMESAALAALARTADVPFVAIRAVSDTASARVPECLNGAIDSAGRLSMANTVTQLLLRPTDWAAVGRLALGFHAARVTLTGVARRIGLGVAAAIQ